MFSVSLLSPSVIKQGQRAVKTTTMTTATTATEEWQSQDNITINLPSPGLTPSAITDDGDDGQHVI